MGYCRRLTRATVRPSVRTSENFFEIFGFLEFSRQQFLTIFLLFEKNVFWAYHALFDNFTRGALQVR